MNKKLSAGLSIVVILYLCSSPASLPAEQTRDFSGDNWLTMETPRLDHQRIYYGTFQAQPRREPREPREPRVQPVIKTEIEDVPTFAEVEAAKAKATAEAAMEMSQRAEEIAREAREEARQARAISEKALEAANQGITRANEAVSLVNLSIDRINEINEKLTQDIARVRFDMEQKHREFAETIAGIQQEIEEFKIQLPEIYMVKRSDYLIKIATIVYGDGSQWRRIFEANRDKIRNPNLIFPGQTLTIPR